MKLHIRPGQGQGIEPTCPVTYHFYGRNWYWVGGAEHSR